MPGTGQRAQDYQLIADTAANKEAIGNMKDDMVEVKDDLHDISKKLDDHIDEVSEKLDAVIRRLDAQANQFLGASRLAKFLWFAFPAASAGFAWFMAKKVGA